MSNENESMPKKRGVKPGTVRPTGFVHAAVKDGELIQEFVLGSLEDSSKEFENKFGLAPQKSSFAVYEYKGKKSKVSSSRDSVRLDTKDLLKFTSTQFEGEYKGWKVVGSGMEAMTIGNTSYAENELIRVILTDPVKEGNRKPRLADNEVIPASLIENLQAS